MVNAKIQDINALECSELKRRNAQDVCIKTFCAFKSFSLKLLKIVTLSYFSPVLTSYEIKVTFYEKVAYWNIKIKRIFLFKINY